MSDHTADITIRQATAQDAAAVRACLAAAFEPYRVHYTPDAFQDTVPTVAGLAQRLGEMTVLIAEDEDGVVVGTIGYQIVEISEGHLRGMAVVPAQQGSGVAAQLLAAAEHALRRQHCTRVTLDTTRYLQQAIRFYSRHGYTPTGVTNDFFGMTIIEFAKPLESSPRVPGEPR